MNIKSYFNKIVNFIYQILQKTHTFLKKPPKYPILEGINVIIVGIDSLIVSENILPNAFDKLENTHYTLAIFIIILTIFSWGLRGIYQIIFDNKIVVPIKYKFIINILFIPTLLLINKFIIYFKNTCYERQDNINP